jgi:hypothetical protein
MRASNLISGVCCARGDVQAQLERDRLLPPLLPAQSEAIQQVRGVVAACSPGRCGSSQGHPRRRH